MIESARDAVKKEAVQKAIDYIEAHLPEPLPLEVLAKAAGYSKYHFQRLFLETVHMTPAVYIRRRRISEVVRAMGSGEGSISTLAFAWGFNSKENFTRAFKSEHHILPTEFKSAGNSLKLWDRITLEEPSGMPEGVPVMLEPFRLIVLPSDEAVPSDFWNRYNVGGWSARLSGGVVTEDWGVSLWDPAENRLRYFIGIREEMAQGDLTGTVPLAIPGGMYIRFDTPVVPQFRFIATVQQIWAGVSRWMTEHGYRRTGGYEMEYYTESSRSFTETILIPAEPVR